MNSSSAARVPEPGSRTMKPSPISAFAGTFSICANGCSIEVTSTCGCIANGSARVGHSFGGRPMIASSTLPCCISATTCSRLLLTCRRISMPGCSSRNCASMRGTKYLAVLTMPTSSTPVERPRKRATMSSASRIAASTRRVCASTYSPTMVSDTLRLERSNSGKPDLDLQVLDLHRDCGRGEAQFLRGAHEAQVPRDRRRIPAAGGAWRSSLSYSYYRDNNK